MAGILRPDDIDFSAHMRDTECKAKVRSAAHYEADLLQELKNIEAGARVLDRATQAKRNCCPAGGRLK